MWMEKGKINEVVEKSPSQEWKTIKTLDLFIYFISFKMYFNSFFMLIYKILFKRTYLTLVIT